MSTTLHLDRADGVATIRIDHPPVNVLDAALMRDLRDALTEVAADDDTRVVVLRSANPDFFVAHVDMGLVDDPHAFDGFGPEVAAQDPGLNPFQALGELVRHLPQVSIVELAGLARGGGAELVAAADLAYAATETAGIGQIESQMGLVPGGGGTQYLRSRTTRSRALEVVLAGELYDATTAAAYGWVTRAVPAADLPAYVAQVARRIAALPEGVVAAAKAALPPEDLRAGLRAEHDAWASTIARPAAERLIRAGLEAGAQTVEGERDLEGLLRAIA
jgi:enoyl-CoA hydratase/carnithine racemase